MEYTVLGDSDLRVSRLGFGGCPMGGHGWGAVDLSEIERAIHIALDHGVNLFDTADIYGFGESEKVLGRVLKTRRDEFVVATKFGVRRIGSKITYDNSPGWIEKALEMSLKRLGVECIDLYQIHYKDESTPWEEIFETLERKREQGKIRYYGLSNIFYKDVAHLELPDATVSFQLEYSLANRAYEMDILEMAKEKMLGFLSWGSLGQGILSGKYRHDTRFPQDDRRSRKVYENFHRKFERNLALVEIMKQIGKHKKKSLPQIAIRWIMDNLEFGVALVGVKTTSQIRDNLGTFGWRLRADEVELLKNAAGNIT
jgi:myo-inositol catabolism protein IolS